MVEEATHPSASKSTKKALDEVSGKPEETIAVAASRLTDAFLALIVYCDGHHASETMLSRRYTPEKWFDNLLGRRSVISTPKPLSQVGPPKDDEDAVMAVVPPKGAKELPAGSARNPGIDDSRLSTIQRNIDGVRDLSLGQHGVQQDGSRLAKGKAPVRRSYAKPAGITRQPTPATEEHGVPFLDRNKSHSSFSKGSSSQELEITRLLAP